MRFQREDVCLLQGLVGVWREKLGIRWSWTGIGVGENGLVS